MEGNISMVRCFSALGTIFFGNSFLCFPKNPPKELDFFFSFWDVPFQSFSSLVQKAPPPKQICSSLTTTLPCCELNPLDPHHGGLGWLAMMIGHPPEQWKKLSGYLVYITLNRGIMIHLIYCVYTMYIYNINTLKKISSYYRGLYELLPCSIGILINQPVDVGTLSKALAAWRVAKISTWGGSHLYVWIREILLS